MQAMAGKFGLLSSALLGKRMRSLVPNARSFAQQIAADHHGLNIAAASLRGGGLVAFPTETVYGLGANALDSDAVEKVFRAKRRPSTDPLIVHIAQPEMLDDYFDFSSADPLARSVCQLLANSFWPGPLTIVFTAKACIPSAVTAGTSFVGLRSPRHPIARALLQCAGLPIAAPSANRFGHVSPTSSQHVIDDLGEEPDLLVLEDDSPVTGGCQLGIESTVLRVDPSGRRVDVLRGGAVTPRMLAACLQSLPSPVQVVWSPRHQESGPAVAPGQMLRHYAPDLPTFLVPADLVASPRNFADVQTAVVIDVGGRLVDWAPHCLTYFDLSPTGHAKEACASLFQRLRSAEKMQGATVVLLPDLSTECALPSATPAEENDSASLARALWDRLMRAASGRYLPRR